MSTKNCWRREVAPSTGSVISFSPLGCVLHLRCLCVIVTSKQKGEGREGWREGGREGKRERLFMRKEPKTNQQNLLNKIRSCWTIESQPLAEGGLHFAPGCSSSVSSCWILNSEPAADANLHLTYWNWTTPIKTGVGLKLTMRKPTKKERPPLERNGGTPMSASAEALDSPSSQTQAEPARATLTPRPACRCGVFCQPWCLLLVLTLLLLSLLGSWAVVHLSLGTRGGSPFRVSASYDQRGPQDDTATIEPHFTTNCTMGKLRHSLSFHSEALTVWCHFFKNVSVCHLH